MAFELDPKTGKAIIRKPANTRFFQAGDIGQRTLGNLPAPLVDPLELAKRLQGLGLALTETGELTYPGKTKEVGGLLNIPVRVPVEQPPIRIPLGGGGQKEGGVVAKPVSGGSVATGQAKQLTPEQQKKIAEIQQKVNEIAQKTATLKEELAKRKLPTEEQGISAASLGNVLSSPMKDLEDKFQSFEADLTKIRDFLAGDIGNILDLSKAELEARKASIERQVLEQKQALEKAEQQAKESISLGYERLGLRNIIVGKQLDELTKEEARVSAEFAKAHAMLDAMKEEALTQAIATQRAEDRNRLAEILNVKIALLNQQMSLWQTYQNTKLNLRQQLLNEVLTREQLSEARKKSAINDLEIILKPYAGSGLPWNKIPQKIREEIERIERETNLPITDIAQKLIANKDIDVKSVDNTIFVYNRTTGEVLDKMTKPTTPSSLERKALYSLTIDSVGNKILQELAKSAPDYFEGGKFRDARSFIGFINAIVRESGASYNDVLARFDPIIYMSDKNEKEFNKMRQEFEKANKISSSSDPLLLFSSVVNLLQEQQTNQ